jgi:hypothetical protein
MTQHKQANIRQVKRNRRTGAILRAAAADGSPGAVEAEVAAEVFPVELVAFGVPRSAKRPIAGRFGPHEAGIAHWLARQRGLGLLAANTEPARQVAAHVPPWQLQPDGTPVLAPITHILWQDLRNLAPSEPTALAPPRSADGEGSAELLACAEALWAAIGVGDVVLAAELDSAGKPDGWWEAVVLGGDGDAFTLAWRDYHEQGLIKRLRLDLALLYPRH